MDFLLPPLGKQGVVPLDEPLKSSATSIFGQRRRTHQVTCLLQDSRAVSRGGKTRVYSLSATSPAAALHRQERGRGNRAVSGIYLLTVETGCRTQVGIRKDSTRVLFMRSSRCFHLIRQGPLRREERGLKSVSWPTLNSYRRAEAMFPSWDNSRAAVIAVRRLT